MIVEDLTLYNQLITKIEKYSSTLIRITTIGGVITYVSIGTTSYSLDALPTDLSSYVKNLPTVRTVNSLNDVVSPSSSDVYINNTDKFVYAYISNQYKVIMDINPKTTLSIPKFVQGNLYRAGAVVSYNGNFYKAFSTGFSIVTDFSEVLPIDAFISACEIDVEGFSGYFDVSPITVTRTSNLITESIGFDGVFLPTISQSVPDPVDPFAPFILESAPLRSLDLTNVETYTVPPTFKLDSIEFDITFSGLQSISGKGIVLNIQLFDTTPDVVYMYSLYCGEGADGDVTIFENAGTVPNLGTQPLLPQLLSGDIVENIASNAIPSTKSFNRTIDTSKSSVTFSKFTIQTTTLAGKTPSQFVLDRIYINTVKEV